MRGLKDKVFLVTGGGSGIGAATVLRLLDEGARVVAAGTRAEGLAKTRADAGQPGDDRLLTVQFDLRDEASVRTLLARTTESFGRLDGVANVAGAVSVEALERDRPVDELDAGVWAEALQINLIGTALVIRESLPALAASGGGSIVNVSSDGVFMGDPVAVAYNAAKAGLHSLTRHTAKSWGPRNVRCNVVAPGLVLSDATLKLVPPEGREMLLERIPLPRHGQPADLASALIFLLSDDSAWITGQIFSVDGGLTMRE